MSKESDEEDDYMSENFLDKCLKKDVKPGLKWSHSDKRKHESDKKKAETKKKLKLSELESVAREEGLSKRLDESNKGFAMLAKMGYKSGESLGNGGRVDPIPISLKSGRSGLGRETAIQLAKNKKKQILDNKKRQIKKEFTTENFRKAMSLKMKQQKIEGDLDKSRKACLQLDTSAKVQEPEERWFWPEPIKERLLSDDDHQEKVEEPNEEQDNLDSNDKLCILTAYLRAGYFYCIWCGYAFSDVNEMTSQCPGGTKEDHDE